MLNKGIIASFSDWEGGRKRQLLVSGDRGTCSLEGWVSSGFNSDANYKFQVTEEKNSG